MPETPDLPPWDDAGRAARRPRWRRAAPVTAFENPWLRLEVSDAVAPTGKPARYAVVHFKNRAVAIFPLHDDGTVSLVGQSRFPLDAYSWELPEGGVPYGEDLLDGAKRELREETGLSAAEWRKILSFDMSNSVTDEAAACYLATGLTGGAVAPDDTEVFDYARIAFKTLLDAVIKGQVRDGLTVACTLRVYHMAKSGGLSPRLTRALDLD